MHFLYYRSFQLKKQVVWQILLNFFQKFNKTIGKKSVNNIKEEHLISRSLQNFVNIIDTSHLYNYFSGYL